MVAAAEKVRAAGNGHVAVCERGTQFGYDDLVVDPRNLVSHSMRRYALGRFARRSIPARADA